MPWQFVTVFVFMGKTVQKPWHVHFTGLPIYFIPMGYMVPYLRPLVLWNCSHPRGKSVFWNGNQQINIKSTIQCWETLITVFMGCVCLFFYGSCWWIFLQYVLWGRKCWLCFKQFNLFYCLNLSMLFTFSEHNCFISQYFWLLRTTCFLYVNGLGFSQAHFL